MSWDFLQRYDESWIWRCADRHRVTESNRNFAALDECIADAVRNGYVQAAAGTLRGAAQQRRSPRRTAKRAG